jgi:hypothetical protein
MDLHANEVYDGDENPMVYKRIYNTEFSCDFELYDYPFDYQKCKIIVSMSVTPYPIPWRDSISRPTTPQAKSLYIRLIQLSF